MSLRVMRVIHLLLCSNSLASNACDNPRRSPTEPPSGSLESGGTPPSFGQKR